MVKHPPRESMALPTASSTGGGQQVEPLVAGLAPLADRDRDPGPPTRGAVSELVTAVVADAVQQRPGAV